MFKHNKLRYWLGMVCVVEIDGMFLVSNRFMFLFGRSYMDEVVSDNY